ncbi:MAG TPA: CHAT domain-containing protein [Polyangiaceae bacterium]
MESVKLELVRPGPLHGQLLSQLTYYMALCDVIEADTVRFPFDHHDLKAYLKGLRYYVGADGNGVPNALRSDSAEQLSGRLAETFEQMRALQTRMAEMRLCNTVRHLRLVLGGSELSLVPFELATIPVGWRGAGTKLSLAPIVVTRELRGSSGMVVQWDRRPRLLFCTAAPAGFSNPPVEAHLLGIANAMRAWVEGGYSDGTKLSIERVVTVIEQASLPAIRAAMERAVDEGWPYTHVHFLCHGCPMPGETERYGLALVRERTSQQLDAVDAGKLATALLGLARHCPAPSMVVLASCDSANQCSVEAPGASLAHELHREGIPWVFASQLPLTFRGSAVLARVLYQGILEGHDPRVVLHEVRQELSREESAHDWASLVAYAAIPPDFDRQVRCFRLHRLKALIDSAFGRLAQRETHTDAKSSLTPEEFKRIDKCLLDWEKLLETSSASDAERAEFYGMKGAIAKRKASLASTADSTQKSLIEAMLYYRKAAEYDLNNHWTVTQYLVLHKLLSKDKKGSPRGWFELAQVAAELDLAKGMPHSAWAMGTLIELAIISEHGRAAEHDTCYWSNAMKAAVEREPLALGFVWFSTKRQLERYVTGLFAGWLDESTKQRAKQALDVLLTVPLDSTAGYQMPDAET